MEDHILPLPPMVRKNTGNQFPSSLAMDKVSCSNEITSRIASNCSHAIDLSKEDAEKISKQGSPRGDRGRRDWVTFAEYMDDDNYWLTPGDLLEFSRESDKPWALYMGNGLVVRIDTAASDFHSGKEHSIPTRGALALSSLNGVPVSARMFADLAIDSMSRNTIVPVPDCPAMTVKLGDQVLEASPDPMFSAPENEFVRIDTLLLAAGKDEFRVNNCLFMRKSHVERSFEEMVNLVFEHVHETFSSDFFTSDSKDYVLYLRYKPKENQDGPPTDAWWNDD